MSRHLSPDEKEAVLSLLAVRSLHNKRSLIADDSEGSDDASLCSNTDSVNNAQTASLDLSSEVSVSNTFSRSTYQSQHTIGFPSAVDYSTLAFLNNGIYKPKKKRMVCECGAFILVRTEWKHKQSKKHIRFMLRKLALNQEKYEEEEEEENLSSDEQPQKQKQRHDESPEQKERTQPCSDPQTDKQEVQQLPKQPISGSRDIVGILYKKTNGAASKHGQQREMFVLTPMYSSSQQQLTGTPFSANLCCYPSGQGKSQHTTATRHAPQQPMFFFAQPPQQQQQQQQWQQHPSDVTAESFRFPKFLEYPMVGNVR